jgi:hydrogenase small subunit
VSQPVLPETAPPETVDVIWLTAGLSCDGDTIALTAATQPSLEDLVLGTIPALPRLRLHNAVLAYENGEQFLDNLRRAAAGRLAPFLLVVEGSIPNEKNKAEGVWAAFGTDPATGQPIPTVEWIDRLSPRAYAVVAAGTCSAYGGVHAMAGNPTGCMGMEDHLGRGWRARNGEGDRVINVPGCPVQPDNMTETLLYLLYQVSGQAPPIPLDDQGRPRWLFGQTLHECCDRAGYYEQADFAPQYGSAKCLVKLGCWGPVVNCNVGKRGWMGGVGGCPSVGGVCIGCTMPGFPDKFMQPSLLDEPPGAKLSTEAIETYGRAIRKLRQYTRHSFDFEPEWRRS